MATQLTETVYRERTISALIATPVKGSRYPSLRKIDVLQRGEAVGIMVAIKKDDGTVSVGWSEFNHRDKAFNRKIGKEIAVSRAMGIEKDITIPTKMWQGAKGNRSQVDYTIVLPVKLNSSPSRLMANALQGFERRASRYFKVNDANVICGR